ncbi:MAG: DUF427 domain-containing protein [Proteobacteria bacterium]|nr:DUF427 domain-containing protein [Pseudomonadota bacterium]MDA0952601.1 DUF427 domain-containing protein [Pseudomonadota bacterium]
MGSTDKAGNAAQGPADRSGHAVETIPCAKRLRATIGEQTLFDTQGEVVLRETGRITLYCIPRGDVRMDLLSSNGTTSDCPFKGRAHHFDATVGGRTVADAAWSYETPTQACAGIAGWLSFAWKKMDHWFEEDEEVFVHARDPHVRIDILESHRPVEIRAGGQTVALTRRARFLFETGHVTRYYIPVEDVRTALLAPSESHTACPYKGTASYHRLKLGERVVEDAVWFYPDPLDEVRRIAGYLCFYPEKVDAILVDGKVVS